MDLEALGPLGGDPGACLLGEEQGGASLQAQGVQEGASRQGQGQEVASHLLLGEEVYRSLCCEKFFFFCNV